MTKDIIWLSIAFILILAICILGQWCIADRTEAISSRLNPLQAAIDSENWQAAQENYDLAREEWQSTAKIWKVLINHDDMRDIEISFVDLHSLLQQKDKDKARQELESLFFYLNHVSENERLNIGNIF